MKSSKAEGARNYQMNGAAAAREAELLFPRLHVIETEKAGPRAPPRNKMALFEQFTVPSHQFVQPQPSSTSTELSNQPQQFDHQHPYFSYCTPSVPYPTPCPRPSRGASSCVTSSVSETQRTSCSQKSEKYSFSKATETEDGNTNLSSLLKEKAKVVSDEVLMQSSPRVHEKAQAALHTPSAFEIICGKFVSASAESAKLPVTIAAKNDTLEAMSIESERLACPEIENQSCAELNKREEVSCAILAKIETLKAGADAADEHNYGCSSFASEPAPDIHLKKVLPEGSSHMNDSNTKLKNNACRDCLAASALKSSRQQVLRSSHVCKDLRLSDREKQDADASVDIFLKDKGDNTGDSQMNQMGSNEVSELSQEGTGRDTDGLLLSAPAVQAIRPKDVIRAVGQQHFWKARKELLRQQRIFSDQVFQLHKLIKVQQLLANIPCMLIDEEMLFGMVDNCAGAPSECNTEGRGIHHDEKAYVTRSSKEQRSKDQGNKTGSQPETTQNLQCYAAPGNDGMGSTMPYVPAFIPGGVSAWGYPSMGTGHWMGALSAQGRPSAYQPFTGLFTAGAPLGGLYGPGAVSPMLPFCTPYIGHEPWEEMSSNGGPSVAAFNAQGAPALGHVAHDGSGPWQFVQYNSLYYNQRFRAGVSEKNASIGSVASINQHRPVKSLNASGTGHILSEGSGAVRVTNNGIHTSRHPTENSSPSSSAYIRSTPASRQAGSYYEKTEQPAQMSTNNIQHVFNSSKQLEVNEAGGREEACKVVMRLSKRCQGDQLPFSNQSAEGMTGHPSGPFRNALELFPLVPFSSTDGGQNSCRQTSAIWQGRVIKAVPHPAVAASQSAAGILLSLQRERQQ
ncbi:hypothetical protein L7F22_046762 [Adiantum nelumboides]|nr:hypothetical protein [Adiantum nelumboides]